MNNLFTTILETITNINNAFFAPIDGLIESLPFEHWILHAFVDSIHMLPFLFVIFLVVEIFEYYFSPKIENVLEKSSKIGPLIGCLLAIFPQCGFSVVASTLYANRMITTGTLISVYVATSDEAIPILLSAPEKASMILPLILTKIVIALFFGYLIDFIFKLIKKNQVIENIKFEESKGCCAHHVSKPRKRDLIYHPLIHTINIFVFVVIISLVINFFIHNAGGGEALAQNMVGKSMLQIVSATIFGLIPNCAASVGITLLYINNTLAFAPTVAGLCSSAGLGLIVLVKKNKNKLDTLKIILLLMFISIFSGVLLQLTNIK